EIAAAEAEQRLRSAPWEPAVADVTARDLRIGGAPAIWVCQQVRNEERLIDYHENSGVGRAHYAGMLLERKQRGWAWSRHLPTHAASVRELGTGRSRVETLQSLGINPRVLPAMPVEDGINAVRTLLPRCWFDAQRCAKGLEALRQYRCEWDDRLRTFKPHPLHDWTSHAAD